jgi:2-dehydro-3-deoxyphosphogluconate aldolase/(4S)-4-hydroxy-2-oxoglutarate aldolase
MDVIKELSLIGLVPVIKIDDAKDAAPLAKALYEGGLPCAEVTFRTAAAAEAIAEMVKACPDMLVGAGTVLTTAQVDEAVAAGAKFIVSPGLNPTVVKYCVDKDIPVMPGINNPSGIEQAMELGLKVVKFFPAEPSGGLNMLKAMAAPYGGVRFMPTGGISPANVGDYLAWNRIIACGGSWMVPPKMLAEGNFEGIKRLAREAVDTMLSLRFTHLGVNCKDEAECREAAEVADRLFGYASDERSMSIFAGTPLEFMKAPGRGTMGHVAIATPNVDRAVYHLTRRGAKFDESSALYEKDGSLKFIYITDEIAGFAYHLVKG